MRVVNGQMTKAINKLVRPPPRPPSYEALLRTRGMIVPRSVYMMRQQLDSKSIAVSGSGHTRN